MQLEDLEQLQTKIAFLERAHVQLSDVVYRQHQDIRVLSTQISEILERLDATQCAASAPGADDERPPHY